MVVRVLDKHTHFMSNKPITADSLVGFLDGEGCFTIHISRRQSSRFGLFFTPSLSVSQNTTSVSVLEDIQAFFGCGFIRPDRKTSKYLVRDLEHLVDSMLPFFQKHPLRTSKNKDFLLFFEIWSL